jgi:hypothetical protein
LYSALAGACKESIGQGREKSNHENMEGKEERIMLIKETRSADMERDNKVTVIIDCKNSSDALEVHKAITAALQKENRRRNRDISYRVICSDTK